MKKSPYVPVKIERRRMPIVTDPERRNVILSPLYAEHIVRAFTSGQFGVPYVEFTSERLYSDKVLTTEINNKTIQTVWPVNTEYLGEYARRTPETTIVCELRNAKEA